MSGVFTDDDLKRLKEAIAQYSDEEHPKLSLFQDTVEALLSRLAAAEVYANACPVPFGAELVRLRDAWRKAAGK